MRLLLLGIAIVSLTVHGAAQSAPTPAQSQQAGNARPTFEVASIKRNVSGEQNASVRPQPGGRLVITNNSLYNMIRNAYNTQRFEMVPGQRVPSWIDSDRWDVTAKAADEATPPQQMMVMLQNLLADRFKLDARREVREMPVYALVVARSDGRLGPQLKASSADCNALAAAARAGGPPPTPPPGVFCGTRTGPGVVQMSGVPLANFVRNLGGMTGRFVVDKTGLSGPYDLELKWTPDQAIGGGGAATDGTSLFTAMQEQLGLRLEAQRAPVEVLVIESAERPTEN